MGEEHTHRLVRGRHRRKVKSGTEKYEVGDPITPSDAELSAFGDKFEPIARTPEDDAAEAEEDAAEDGAAEEPEPEPEEEPDLSSLTEIDGVGAKTARSLYDAGYETADDLADASEDELYDIDGIGPSAVSALISAFGDE